MRIYNMPTLPTMIPNAPATSNVVATTTDRKLIAIAGAEGLVRILDLAGVVSREWKVPGAPITGLAFHPLATPPVESKTEPVTRLAT